MSKQLKSVMVTCLLIMFGLTAVPFQGKAQPTPKPRILISSDIGGSDDDDFQSAVHLLMYSNLFEIEGLVSSPYGKGTKKDFFDVIDLYEKDLPIMEFVILLRPRKSALMLPPVKYLSWISKAGSL